MKKLIFLSIAIFMAFIFMINTYASNSSDFSFTLKEASYLGDNGYLYEIEYVNNSENEGIYELVFTIETSKGLFVNQGNETLNESGSLYYVAKDEKLSLDIVSFTVSLKYVDMVDTEAELSVDVSNYKKEDLSKGASSSEAEAPKEREYKTNGSNYLAFLIPLGVLSVIGVATFFALNDYKKKKSFLDSYDKCEIGENIDSVKKIMESFELILDSYTKDGENILKYKIKNNEEVVSYIFSNDVLILKTKDSD